MRCEHCKTFQSAFRTFRSTYPTLETSSASEAADHAIEPLDVLSLNGQLGTNVPQSASRFGIHGPTKSGIGSERVEGAVLREVGSP